MGWVIFFYCYHRRLLLPLAFTLVQCGSSRILAFMHGDSVFCGKRVLSRKVFRIAPPLSLLFLFFIPICLLGHVKWYYLVDDGCVICRPSIFLTFFFLFSTLLSWIGSSEPYVRHS